MATSVLVPLKTDAFVLNQACCEAADFRIAPISQPNYTFLRLGIQDYLLEADILDHVDLHATKPAAINSRVTDLGDGKTRRNRLGVYLHWTLPPFYRMGIGSTADQAAKNDARRKQEAGFPSSSLSKPALEGAQTDTAMPQFRPVPNRWLVTRRIKPGSYSPPDAKIPLFQSWIIQSDAIRKLSDVDDPLRGLDLEVDAAPFMDSTFATADRNVIQDLISRQAEVFVGKKVDFEKWDRATADSEPHVDLNVMTSANPLLPDYQIHNPNIFSMLDNFAYKNDRNEDMYLESAQADYSIIGWHSEAEDDPMTTMAQVNDNDVPSHSDRLDSCRLKLKDYSPAQPNLKEWGTSAAEWLKKDGGAARSDSRTLCHSTMYDVKWNSKDLPKFIGAKEAGEGQKNLTFAVGTSDLDALVAYFEALAANNSSMKDTRADISRLIHILGETGDGDIDSLQKFSDEAYKLAFTRFDAGPTWFWKEQSDPGEKPAQASESDIKNLDDRNMHQAAIENVKREIADLRWKIFAIWWTGVSSAEVRSRVDFYKAKLTKVLERLNLLGSETQPGTVLYDLTPKLEKTSAFEKHTKGASPNFYTKKDPTILFSGIESGWEPDFSDVVQVRLHQQIVGGGSDDAPDWASHAQKFQEYARKAPDAVRSGVEALLTEFYELRSSREVSSPPNPKLQVLPYFRETKRDLWQDRQPWRPLFIEWEALYYHIPFERWNSQETMVENKFGAKVLQYTVPGDVSKMFNPQSFQDNDIIRITGRNYLQPQSQSVFKILLQQVFDNTNPEDLQTKFNIAKDDQKKLLDILSSGKFVTAPLTSITNSLLTMHEGSHLKPLVRLPGATPVAMKQAVDTFNQICPSQSDPTTILQQIDDQGDLTPFASVISVNRKFYPMKPVQHGQLQFIKMNIVDKFGQAVAIIDPSPPVNGRFNTTSPIISQSLSVGAITENATTRANTALRQTDPNACPFISIAPSINQPTRINSVFVHKVLDAQDQTWKWRRTSDWDNPIWGWLVVNYADSGLQLFRDDGQFYREIRFGSRAGTSVGFKYLPFDPPKTEETAEQANKTRQLDFLIGKLRQKEYLEAFWDMINTSFTQESFAHAPTSYSTFSSAVVGKPLALVNAGWSLQLANQPRENWTTVDATTPVLKPPRTLLNTDRLDDPTLRWTDRQWKADDPQGYTFQLKIGDDSRRYDGLVGYFLPNDQPLKGATSDLNLDKLYTFGSFIQTRQTTDPRIQIEKSNYMRLTPYWIAPGAFGEPLDRHDDKLHVLGMLIDPFLPIHAFSGILPTKTLTLPPWTVEQALKKMTAFWHVGPLVAPKDVDLTTKRPLDDSYTDLLAKYVRGQVILAGSDDQAGVPSPSTTTDELPTVRFPLAPPVAAGNGGDAKFMYLQPYTVSTQDKNGTVTLSTKFTPFAIDGQTAAGADALEAKLLPGPYTALEGYLQIAKPLSDEIVSA